MDSKCKTHPIRYRNANELRHGIDRKDWVSYGACSGINRQKCFLGLVELLQENEREWSGSLLMQSLEKLGKPIPGFSTQQHMVYWPRASFVQVGTMQPLELYETAHKNRPVSDDIRANVIALLGGSDQIQAMAF